MTSAERKQAALSFVERWKNTDYLEKQADQKFWNDLLVNVYGISSKEIKSFIEYQYSVTLPRKHTGWIDGYIKDTGVIIEHKAPSIKDLFIPEKQSDGSLMTPAEQAYRYGDALNHDPNENNPRYVITCNFNEFHIYEFNKQDAYSQPEILKLEELPDECERLLFLVDAKKELDNKELQVSKEAGDLIGIIYKALAKQYKNIETDENEQSSLNILCVRLVFLMYAEDAGIFEHNQFRDYLSNYSTDAIRQALIVLFKVLDTPKPRDPYLSPILNAFGHVNGGLFEKEDIIIPQFTEELRNLLINEACKFDWRRISPTIFGAIFESTLNPVTRRKGGMHYTSIENIHKVIDPLFLNDLREEFEQIKSLTVIRDRKEALRNFHNKISSLKFLDPACGSGNFLTESYLSLRRLENDIIRTELVDSKHTHDSGIFQELWIKVSIQQFYGIEINDFAVDVAKTALWIAEYQMFSETMALINGQNDFLPLETYENIKKANALRVDWNEILSADDCDYIMGNPPFIGYKEKNDSQKEDLRIACVVDGNTIKNTGSLDYVSGWYYKAVNYSGNRTIKTAFVSTNSITQGEQVAIMWKPLHEKGLNIDYAYHTFRWDSEANIKAHVHCIIVGFNMVNPKKYKTIYIGDQAQKVSFINYYLQEGPIVWIYSRSKPLCDVKPMTLGVHIFDDHNFIFTQQEYENFITAEPKSAKYFKKWVSADDFINNSFRYYLDLKDCPPDELQKMPRSYERVTKVLEYRKKNKSCEKLPYLRNDPFRPKQGWKADSDYLLIPNTSGERTYIPMAFVSKDIVVTMPDLALPNADLYDFGILESAVHMAWVRTVAGRLEMRYRYAHGIVYNNFPWPSPNEKQIDKIKQTAQNIILAREKYADKTLYNLYDSVAMPSELRQAHLDNDKAVMAAYGFKSSMTEIEIVEELMRKYQELTK